MAQKAATSASRIHISGVRAGRLYKLLKFIDSGPVSRAQLLRKLKVGVRTFYRDVDLLRGCDVQVEAGESGYTLKDDLDGVLGRLPFPDPELTFGDVLMLMKGRSASHQRLRQLFKQLSK